MRIALFSDIHSNLEALEKAVSDTKGRKINRIAVLGDTVGYGANPNECLEWVLKNASVYVTGNHEKAVRDPRVRERFNQDAYEAIVWTEKVVDEKLAAKIDDLTYLRIEEGLTFAHGSPDDPEQFKYLFSMNEAAVSFKKMTTRICFVGHTHLPCCFCEAERSAAYLAPGILKLRADSRYILNPGSVGQPRDRDPRLAYGIYDDQKETFEIVRLEYDNEKAAAKIRKAGLPRFLADRLL